MSKSEASQKYRARKAGAYIKNRRRKERERKDSFFRQQRNMRETNEARISDGRGLKGGGTFRGTEPAEDQAEE